MIQLSRHAETGFVEYTSHDLDAYFKESEQIKTVSYIDVRQSER
jgi:redox-regulated HSP33 family molecular chaperone